MIPSMKAEKGGFDIHLKVKTKTTKPFKTYLPLSSVQDVTIIPSIESKNRGFRPQLKWVESEKKY